MEETQTAQIGAHVVIELILVEGVQRMEFDLVEPEFADFTAGFLGANTPLAQAILGEKAGVTLPYFSEDTLGIRLLSIGPALSAPPPNLQERRQETLRKAVDQSDRTNAMIFASSFSGKWGDYDPTAFTGDASPPEED